MNPIRLALAAVAVVGLGACATSSSVAPTPVKATVRTEPALPAQASVPTIAPQGTLEAPAPAPLPRLEGSSAALSEGPKQRIEMLNAEPGTSIGEVVREIGKRFGMNVVVDPDVQKTVSAHLRNVTLDEALQQIVRSNGLSYQIQGRTLYVTPQRFETRMFTLDYVAISRLGTANTTIQRRFTSASNIGIGQNIGTATGLSTSAAGLGAVGLSGGDVISSTTVSDLWAELRVSLLGLMGEGAPGAATASGGVGTAPTTAQGGGGTTVNGAFAASWPSGAALTLSPSSGLITVTAGPEKLAQIETYIAAFQASVLRQVLIEAKFVEVNLTNSLQYGIDWNVVSKSGDKTFAISSNTTTTTGSTGNIAFSLPGGSTQVTAVLTALSTQGNVRVLTDARTTALNNARAVFDVTTDEVFFAETRTPLFGANGAVVGFSDNVTPQQVSVGIVLDVQPQISADNVLTMNIRPVVTSLNRVETFTAGDGTTARFPVTDRREGDTMARVRNGETIVVGGLMQKQITQEHSGIPILKDIPLIGKLFQHVNDVERNVELVVFITPTVQAGQPGAGR